MKNRVEKLTAERLREILDYDRETGVFVWKVKPSQCITPGDVAGAVRKDGYIRIQVAGRKYLAHRLAWLHVTGEWPGREIDHCDGNGLHNHFSNLREVGRSMNMQNLHKQRRDNAAGLLGAHRQGNGFQSSINVDGALMYLGYFDTAEEAHLAYLAAKRSLHAGCTI